MDPSGSIEYANSQWYKISGHPEDDVSAGGLSWTNAIFEDDQAYFTAKWEELITQKKTVTIEARMQTPWEGDIGGSIIKIQRWILALVSPTVDENGTLQSVMGCKFSNIHPFWNPLFSSNALKALLLRQQNEHFSPTTNLPIGITDISSIKWAEGLQNRRLKEAEETRRAQNNFIDITSHEMRNPLSAIIQCADGITTSLNALVSTSRTTDPELTEAIKESIASAETIQLCAQHQKNIVDDVS